MVWVAGYGRRVLDSTYNKNRPFNRKTALNIYDESTPDTCIFCNTLHSCQYVGGGGRNTKKHWICTISWTSIHLVSQMTGEDIAQ